MTERVISAVLTRAGLRAVFNATNSGLKMDLSHIALGSTGYTPNGGETGLNAEFARAAIGGGEYLNDFEILVEGMFDGPEAGWTKEVGIFGADGTLFALWSEADSPLAYKTANVPLVIGLTLAVSDVPAGALNIVVGAPSVNITIAGPWASMSAEIIRLQRRAVETEIARLIPTIKTKWS